MENKFSNIKSRIVYIIEKQGLNKEVFFKEIGMTSANFRGDAQKRPLNSNAIENILSKLPNINPEWLITGKGEMLKDNSEPKEKKIITLADTKEVIQLQKEKADLEKLSSKKDKEIEFLRANIDRLVELLNKQADQMGKK